MRVYQGQRGYSSIAHKQKQVGFWGTHTVMDRGALLLMDCPDSSVKHRLWGGESLGK